MTIKKTISTSEILKIHWYYKIEAVFYASLAVYFSISLIGSFTDREWINFCVYLSVLYISLVAFLKKSALSDDWEGQLPKINRP